VQICRDIILVKFPKMVLSTRHLWEPKRPTRKQQGSAGIQGSISSCSEKKMMLDPQTQGCQIFIEWPWLPWPAEVQGLGLASSRVLDLPRNNENLPIKHGRYFN
jgi:hypothetical protein